MEIENIEDMRVREGIDDIELREEIRRLRTGDWFVAGAFQVALGPTEMAPFLVD